MRVRKLLVALIVLFVCALLKTPVQSLGIGRAVERKAPVAGAISHHKNQLRYVITANSMSKENLLAI